MCVSISDVQLLSVGGLPLTVARATSPTSDSSPKNEGPSAAIDGLPWSKWLDPTFRAVGQSELYLYFNSAQVVAGYRLWTSQDAPKRDPTDWRFEAQLADGSWTLLENVQGTTPPYARNAAYDDRWLIAPPPPPPPSPSPQYRLVVTSVRFPFPIRSQWPRVASQKCPPLPPALTK